MHAQPGPRARHFDDSVGVGWYPIDIHRAGPDDVGVSTRTRPFQIPAGALVPIRLENLHLLVPLLGNETERAFLGVNIEIQARLTPIVDAAVPGVGNVIEQLADELSVRPEGETEFLHVRLAYSNGR